MSEPFLSEIKIMATQLLTEVLAQARAVQMHLEHVNLARRLYDRLGFDQVADQGVYLLLEWKPSPAKPQRG